jgi:two-component system phosphate regulon sensor histidine kinase PhoR
MELLLIILIVIIGLLTFLLLKKERVFGIKTETNISNENIKFV